jgi:uncharacterized membrane protein
MRWTMGGALAAAAVVLMLGVDTAGAKKPPKPPPGGDGPTYTVVDLGALGGLSEGNYSFAVDINNAGMVVGTSASESGGPDRAFAVVPEDTDGDGKPDRWHRDSNGDGVNDLMINLGVLPNGTDSHGIRVNDLGQVVGSSRIPEPFGAYIDLAYLWEDLDGDGESDPGEMRNLGTLSAGFSCVAQSINNLGQVVGYSGGHSWIIVPKDTDGDGDPDLWFEGPDSGPFHQLLVNDLMVDLGQGGAARINDAGEIVFGPYLIRPEDTNGDGEPDRWFRDDNGDGVNDLRITLPPLPGGGAWLAAWAINSAGVIAGGSDDKSKQSKVHAVRWVVDASGDATITDLGQLARKFTVARGLNASGQIAGTPGFLWDKGTLHDLMDLLSNAAGVDSLDVGGINDSGLIAGEKNGRWACLLLPTESD